MSALRVGLLAPLAVAIPLALAVASAARDDTPPELLEAKNPVDELSAKRVTYFQKQFKAKCARCHGERGDGGGAEAQQQDVPPADLTNAEIMSKRTDGQLFHQILVGGLPRCAMPAFGPKSDHGWPEQKVWEMVAYVRLLSEKPSD